MTVGNNGVVACNAILDARDDGAAVGNVMMSGKNNHVFVYCTLRPKVKDSQHPSFERQNARRGPAEFQRPAGGRRLVALRMRPSRDRIRLPHLAGLLRIPTIVL